MTSIEAILILLTVLPFLGSKVVIFFRPSSKNNEAFFAGSIAGFCLLYTLLLYPTVSNGGVARYSFPFLTEYGFDVSIRMDGLSWLFSLLITGIGFLVVIYTRYYMAPSDPVPRFFSYFLAFMGSMLGLVLAGNLIFMFVFWELTSIFSFLLIGYWSYNARAREGARMALILTSFGGGCLFLAILLIGHVAGSFDIDVVLNAREKILSSPFFIVILLCLLVGTFTKSAQFPFHFWLPEAMTAPTPVSAYLHSATMVKAGIFLLARFWPVFSYTAEWFWLLGLAGLTTLLFGAYSAMFQKDMKALLAYSTLSHLGLIVTLLSLGSPLACVAAVFHIINHATFKSSLFMAAGIIEHEAGTRDMRQLSGLFRFMPITASLALFASAAMAGVPLLNGFLSKEMFFDEAVRTHRISWLDALTPYIATLASVFSIVYSIRFIHGIFFGAPAVDLPKAPHEPPYFMRLPVEFLVLICILVGVAPNWTIKPLLETAVASVLHGSVPTYSLALWHGWSAALLMSIIALCGGGIFYIFMHEKLKYQDFSTYFFAQFRARRIFSFLLDSISTKIAPLLMRIFSTNRLQKQLRIVFVLIFVFSVPPFFKDFSEEFYDSSQIALLKNVVFGKEFLSFNTLIFGSLWVVGGLCAVGAAWQAKFHRLSSIMLLGGTGLVSCITFALFSAPDLALTQILVEIVTTILLLLGLRWLPQRLPSVSTVKKPFWIFSRRVTDLFLAIIGGVSMAFFSYHVMILPEKTNIGAYFLENAFSISGGENVVNVMLVDFRAFDTLGESAVLAIVALTIFALLRRFRPAPESVDPPFAQRMHRRLEEVQPGKEIGLTLYEYLLIPSILQQWLFPFIVALALFLLLRGHDMPGGGFAAGITLSIAFILQYLVTSTKWVESHLKILPIRWMAAGLFLAVLSGFIGNVLGGTFLTSFFAKIPIEFFGKIPISTAFIFDIGVFSLVLGAVVLILIVLAHQSIRGYRSFKAPELEADQEKQENAQNHQNVEKMPLRE